MEIVRKVSVSEAAENTVCFVNSCDTGDEGLSYEKYDTFVS